jgi:hypothetical protein
VSDQHSLEEILLMTCPARTEPATLAEWYQLANKHLPDTFSLDDFRTLAEDLEVRALVRKRGGRYFDPQKTTRF